MNRILSRAALALALVCAGFAAVAVADVASPKNEPRRREAPWQNTAAMTIEWSDSVNEAELWLPLSAVASDSGATPAGTVASGAALSLAFVTGGLWLARRRLGSKGAGIAAGVVCVLAGASAYTFANLGPPERLRPQDPGTLVQALTGDAKLSGHVRLRLDPTTRDVRLVLPKPKAK